ncbi:MAG: hypothetical protein E4H03_09895 [Myxococcales bacterium]|nr:MAG: hypothetical protein E4H03_09895 [Myxococcales bacterium]
MAASGRVTGANTRNDPPVASDWGLVVRIVGPIVVGPVTFVQPTIGTVTTIVASVVPSVYLAANAARLGAIIQNDSPSRFLFVKLAAGVSPVSYTVRIGPRSYFEVPFPAYTGVIEGVCTVGGASFAVVTELT